VEAKMRAWMLLFPAAILLAGCATPEPQIIESTVEVTRMVEVTRIVEATRIVEVTPTPAPTVPAAQVPGPIDVAVQVSAFWASREAGQVNVKTTNESATAVPGVGYRCTVTSEKTGELLVDQAVTAGAIGSGEMDVQWFSFTVKSEHTPGFFRAACEAQGVDPFSSQIYGPGSQTELPLPPKKNDTEACLGALQPFESERSSYLAVLAEYRVGKASYDEFARAYTQALMAYYVAANACR
jgi:hypothetical protein